MGVFRGKTRAFWMEAYGAAKVAMEEAGREAATRLSHKSRRKRARRAQEVAIAGSRQAVSEQLVKEMIAWQAAQPAGSRVQPLDYGPRTTEAIRLVMMQHPAGWMNPLGTSEEMPIMVRSNIAKDKHKSAMRHLKNADNAAELAGGRSLDLEGGHTHCYDMNTTYRLTALRAGFPRILIHCPRGPSQKKTGLPDMSKSQPTVLGARYIEAFPRPPEGYPEEQGQPNIDHGLSAAWGV